MKISIALILLSAFFFHLSCQAPAQRDSEIEVHEQCLVLLTEAWSTAEGKLYSFVKKGNWSKWTREGRVIDVLIGKNGLGWGIGIEDFGGREGPVKKEGDLKSPAGIFRLSYAFGYEKAEASFRWPYEQIIPTTVCVEDITSRQYNRIVDEDAVQRDWKGKDHMLRKDDLYEWGVFIQHNPQQEKGRGSCIFLHVWRPGGSGTAGCTSMDKGEMKKLISWLDPKANVRLVQVPKSEYSQLEETYDLPSFVR